MRNIINVQPPSFGSLIEAAIDRTVLLVGIHPPCVPIFVERFAGPIHISVFVFLMTEG